MTIGLIGRKCGMTRVFSDDGSAVAVTVIHVEPNRVTQVKTTEDDNYQSIQVTFGKKKSSRVNKPEAGHFVKAGVEAGLGLYEFRLDVKDAAFKVGDENSVSIFTEGQYVDVTGVSKGKGFAGVIKRYHFATQDATHGNSLSHRAPGSIGQRQTPGRVFKGKRMAGHLGAKQITIQNQKVVRVDSERNLLLVSGVVPGAINGRVVVMPAVKIEHVEGAK